MEAKQKVKGRLRRHRRVRKKIEGTPDRPRLAVYRSNRHIYGQVIDDVEGRTLAAASSLKDGKGDDPKSVAETVGEALATRAQEAGVTVVAFDRGGFRYHGRVKAFADGARKGGLDF
jgi:large subunit ribosomal protein L18